MKSFYRPLFSFALFSAIVACGQNPQNSNSDQRSPVEPVKEDAPKAKDSAPFAILTRVNTSNLSKEQTIDFALIKDRKDLTSAERLNAAFESAPKISLTRSNNQWVVSSDTLRQSAEVVAVDPYSHPGYGQGYGYGQLGYGAGYGYGQQPVPPTAYGPGTGYPFGPQYGYAPGYGPGYGPGFGGGYVPGLGVSPQPGFGAGMNPGFGPGIGYGYGVGQNIGFGMPFMGPLLGWMNDAAFTAVNVATAINMIQCMFKNNPPHYNYQGWNMPYYPAQPVPFANGGQQGFYQPYYMNPQMQPIPYNQSPYYTNPGQPQQYQWPQSPNGYGSYNNGYYQPAPNPNTGY